MTDHTDTTLIQSLADRFPAIPHETIEAAYAFALTATVLGDQVPALIRAGDATRAKKAMAAAVELQMIGEKIADGTIGVTRVGDDLGDIRSYQIHWPDPEAGAVLFPDGNYVVGTLVPLTAEQEQEINALVEKYAGRGEAVAGEPA